MSLSCLYFTGFKIKAFPSLCKVDAVESPVIVERFGLSRCGDLFILTHQHRVSGSFPGQEGLFEATLASTK